MLAPHFLSSSIRQRYRRSHRHSLLAHHLPTPQLQTCSRSFRPFNNQRQGRGNFFFSNVTIFPARTVSFGRAGPFPYSHFPGTLDLKRASVRGLLSGCPSRTLILIRARFRIIRLFRQTAVPQRKQIGEIGDSKHSLE